MLNHHRNKHPEEWALRQRSLEITKNRTDGLRGRQTILNAVNDETFQRHEADIPDIEAAYRLRIEANQRELESIFNAINAPSIRLQTRRRFDIPDSGLNRYERQAIEHQTEPGCDTDSADPLMQASQVLDSDDDSDFEQTANVLTNMFHLNETVSAFDLSNRMDSTDCSNELEMNHGCELEDGVELDDLSSTTGTDQSKEHESLQKFFSTLSSEAAAAFAEQSKVDNEYVVDPARTEIYGNAGIPVMDVPKDRVVLNEDSSPWAPFVNPHDFKTGSWFIRNGATGQMITEGFNSGILSPTEEKKVSFSSPYTLKALVDAMEPDMGTKSWKEGRARFFADVKNEWKLFYYRDVVKMIQQIFRQPAYKEHLIYSPVKEFNGKGGRVYSDLHTADWWWRKQVSRTV